MKVRCVGPVKVVAVVIFRASFTPSLLEQLARSSTLQVSVDSTISWVTVPAHNQSKHSKLLLLGLNVCDNLL